MIVLWEASDRICGKRLTAVLPVLLDAVERHGHLHLDAAVRAAVLAASAATLDRLLAAPRVGAGMAARRRARATSAVRRRVPVRTFADWHDPLPGYLAADLVSHGGASAAGSFVHTLTLTDIATGWTECLALVVREGTLIVDAIATLRPALPFPLRGLDTDNGSEVLNAALLAYCEANAIEFTRSRPYRKNDQAWVEQKNGAVVRRLVGYDRLEGLAAADALARLYAAARLFVNFFQPSFKLASKIRVGARVHKRYHAPATPCARVLASEAVPDAVKVRLRAVAADLDPLRLLDEVRAMQHHLTALAAGVASPVVPPRDVTLDRFLSGLATAWHAGEVRPTHRASGTPRPPRDWRTRTDPFAAVWPDVRAGLEAEPDRTATELFARLQRAQPGAFPDAQLRTLQRRVQAWRRDAAHALLHVGHADASFGHEAATVASAGARARARVERGPAPRVPGRPVRRRFHPTAVLPPEKVASRRVLAVLAEPARGSASDVSLPSPTLRAPVHAGRRRRDGGCRRRGLCELGWGRRDASRSPGSQRS